MTTNNDNKKATKITDIRHKNLYHTITSTQGNKHGQKWYTHHTREQTTVIFAHTDK
jgi:hypothetical protein